MPVLPSSPPEGSEATVAEDPAALKTADGTRLVSIRVSRPSSSVQTLTCTYGFSLSEQFKASGR